MAQGVSETKEDRQRDKDRKQAAEMYDDFDKRVEKHWTEKAREEMTERDWRIFREDFSIAYKGNTGSTLPIRNWQEAGLPQPLMDVRLMPPVQQLACMLFWGTHSPSSNKKSTASHPWVMIMHSTKILPRTRQKNALTTDSEHFRVWGATIFWR